MLHIAVKQLLIQTSVALAFGAPGFLPSAVSLWPDTEPMWVQVLLVGAIFDFGLYAMHRLSHRNEWLWRLHMRHHSPERMYWMNGGRRHPVSALLLAGPALSLLVLLGATPIAVGAWLSILSMHLAFQHSNLNYSLGPLRHPFCVAENHRWHHKREFEDAQVNFGEVFAVWDHLFGSYHDAEGTPRACEVGLIDTVVPQTYLGAGHSGRVTLTAITSRAPPARICSRNPTGRIDTRGVQRIALNSCARQERFRVIRRGFRSRTDRNRPDSQRHDRALRARAGLAFPEAGGLHHRNERIAA